MPTGHPHLSRTVIPGDGSAPGRAPHHHGGTSDEEPAQDPDPGRRRGRDRHPDPGVREPGPGRVAGRQVQHRRVLPLLQQQRGWVGLRLHRPDRRLRRDPAQLLRLQGSRQRQGQVRQEQRRVGLEPHRQDDAGLLQQQLRGRVTVLRGRREGKSERHAEEQQRLPRRAEHLDRSADPAQRLRRQPARIRPGQLHGVRGVPDRQPAAHAEVQQLLEGRALGRRRQLGQRRPRGRSEGRQDAKGGRHRGQRRAQGRARRVRQQGVLRRVVRRGEYNWNNKLRYGTRSHVRVNSGQASFQWMLHF